MDRRTALQGFASSLAVLTGVNSSSGAVGASQQAENKPHKCCPKHCKGEDCGCKPHPSQPLAEGEFRLHNPAKATAAVPRLTLSFVAQPERNRDYCLLCTMEKFIECADELGVTRLA